MTEKEYFEKFTSIQPFRIGNSNDKKYDVKNADGNRFLLRTFDAARYSRKKQELEMLRKATALDIPVINPVEFGAFDNYGGYILFDWIEGANLSHALSKLPLIVQYYFGIRCGELLRKMHTIPAPDGTAEDLHAHYKSKVDSIIKKSHEYGIALKNIDMCLSLFTQNELLLKDRPQSFLHGDVNSNNILRTDDGIVFIDFESFRFGDPWEDLIDLSKQMGLNSLFYTGQIHGYFGGEPPQPFWQLQAFYALINAASVVFWHYDNPNRFNETLSSYEYLVEYLKKSPVPPWYRKWDNNIPMRLALEYNSKEIPYLNTIESSTSWRITKPLRAFKAGMRRCGIKISE